MMLQFRSEHQPTAADKTCDRRLLSPRLLRIIRFQSATSASAVATANHNTTTLRVWTVLSLSVCWLCVCVCASMGRVADVGRLSRKRSRSWHAYCCWMIYGLIAPWNRQRRRRRRTEHRRKCDSRWWPLQTVIV